MVRPGKYIHFKGNMYEVLFEAKHSETGEMMVVYRSLADPSMTWVRPSAMWDEHIERDGYSGPRFKALDD